MSTCYRTIRRIEVQSADAFVQISTDTEDGRMARIALKRINDIARAELAKTPLARMTEEPTDAPLKATPSDKLGEATDTARLDWLAHKSYRKPGPTTFQPVHCIVDSSVWAPRAMIPNEKLFALREAIDSCMETEHASLRPTPPKATEGAQ